MFFMHQHALYGMIRLSALRSVRLQLDIIGSGEIFLQELVQQGDFVVVDNVVWQRRVARAPETSSARLERYRNVLFPEGASRRRFRFFPHAQMMWVYLALPLTIPGISAASRIRMLLLTPAIFARFIPAIVRIDIPWLVKGVVG
jgi:hypothetical protein